MVETVNLPKDRKLKTEWNFPPFFFDMPLVTKWLSECCVYFYFCTWSRWLAAYLKIHGSKDRAIGKSFLQKFRETTELIYCLNTSMTRLLADDLFTISLGHLAMRCFGDFEYSL